MSVQPQIITNPGTPQGTVQALADMQRAIASLKATGGSLAPGSVTGDRIAAGTITAAEIAAGTITATNIAAGAITGSVIAAGTITASNIAAGTITTNEIAANTITAGNIAAATITASQIAANTITAGNIAAATITGSKIAATTITASNIAANTITASQIAANTITAGQIAAATITGTQIAAGTITSGNLSIISGGSNLLRNSSFASGMTNFNSGGTSGSFVTSPVFPGSSSGQVRALTSTAGGQISFGSAPNPLTNLVAILPNTSYVATIWVQSAATARLCQAQLRWYDSSGAFVSATTATATNSTVGAWTAFTVVGTSPSNAVQGAIQVLIAGTVTGEVHYVGALQLQQGTIGSTYTPDGPLDTNATFITPGSITTTQISGTAGITGSQIASTTITGGNIVTGTITASQIAANTITASQIAASTITATQIAAGTITGSNIAAGTITASNLVSGTITATQIAAGTITGSNIAAGTIIASNLVSGTITATQIAANTITGGNIAAGTITASNLVSGTITATQIAASTILGSNIASATITSSNIAAATITGSNIAASTITASQISVSNLSSLSANLGTITAGTVTGATFQTSASNPRVYMDSTGVGAVDSTGTTTFKADASTGKIITLAGLGGGNKIVNSRADSTDTSVWWQPQNATIAQDSSQFRSGAYSFAVTSATASGQAQFYWQSHATAGSIPVYAGQVLTVSGWVLSPTTNLNAKIEVRQWNGSVDSFQSSPSLVASTSWQRVVFTFTVPAGITTIGTGFQFSPTAIGQIVYWTDLQVEEGTLATAYAPKPDEILPAVVTGGTHGSLASATVAGSNIAANTITASLIAANTVTAAQIAAGTITATQIAAGTITGNVIAAATIAGANLIGGTVTATQIAANTITASQIAANTITAAQIAANTIAAGNIVANTITAAQIAANTITAGQIATGTITATQIAASTITGSQIAAGTITASNLNITPGGANQQTNSSFANGTTGWSVTNTTASSLVTTKTFPGSSSGKVLSLTSNGTSPMKVAWQTGTSATPVKANVAYIAGVWVQSAATSRNIQAVLSWYQSSGAASAVRASDTGTAIATMTTGWTLAVIGAIAPSDAATVSLSCNVTNPVNAEVHYVGAFQLQEGTVLSSYTPDGPLDTSATFITPGTITTTQIAGSAGITGGQIATTTITGGNIATGTITASNIAANTITASQIAANTITASQIASATIDATRLNVTQLSAIAADLGTITAGTVTGATIQTASSGARMVLSGAGNNLQIWSSTAERATLDGINGLILSAPASGGDALSTITWNKDSVSGAVVGKITSFYQTDGSSYLLLDAGNVGGGGSSIELKMRADGGNDAAGGVSLNINGLTHSASALILNAMGASDFAKSAVNFEASGGSQTIGQPVQFYCSANQAVAAGATTKINLDTATINPYTTGSPEYTFSSTNHNVTVNNAGYYLVLASVYFALTTAAVQQVALFIRKNAVNVSRSAVLFPSTTSPGVATGFAFVSCNAADALDIAISPNGAGTVQGSSAATFLSIMRVA